MLRNLQKLFNKPFLRNSSQSQTHAIQARILSKEETEYNQALHANKNRLKQVFLGESQQISLLKKCIKDKFSSQKVLEYGEQAIWSLYSDKDFLNAIKCGELLMPYIQDDITQNHISMGHISLVLAESYINQNELEEATKYLKKAEESLFLNGKEIEDSSSHHYYYTLQLAELYQKVQDFNKSIMYASMCLKTQDLAFEQKITPCYLLCQYYMQQNNHKQAIAFGQKLLKEVTFNDLINSYSPREINGLQDLYTMMIDLMYEVEKDFQKAHVLIEEMLLLLKIIKCQDTQIIDSLNQKKADINKKLKKQEDLLFVLGFYGQKLKLEQESFNKRNEQ